MDGYKVDVALSYTSETGMVRHLKVRRRDGKDGISWDDLQKIKNEYLGKEATAVEVYPAHYDLVNQANIRHLWEVPRDSVPNLIG